MRNLGSAVGISITGALLQTNTQVNHALIAADVSPFNRALQTDAASHFWDTGSARGIAMLNEVVTHQARIIAYIDDFKLMLVLAISSCRYCCSCALHAANSFTARASTWSSCRRGTPLGLAV